jgi:hypothetical protein
MSMLSVLETRPEELAPTLPTPLPRRPRRGRRIALGAAALALVTFAVAWAGGALTGSPGASAKGGVSGPAGQGGPIIQTSPFSASGGPTAGTQAGPPAAAAARSGAPAAGSAQPAPATTGSDWTKRDSAVLSPVNAAYFIAGTIFGDPPANRAGVHTMSRDVVTHLRRGAKSGPTLTQLRQAVQVIGGQAALSQSKSGGGRAAFSLPAGTTIVLDTRGSVRINGVDAFGLQRSGSGWTSTAKGSQVRAFLAGFIEGEGSVGGKIGDDPTAAHLAFVQALMSTSQAYGVRTVLTGTRYFALTVASKADYVKVQAYPFITFSRCPGGQP